ncbi:hypothetical protein U1Q18_021382, partial [Sarracenia purpurea var. burkii]
SELIGVGDGEDRVVTIDVLEFVEGEDSLDKIGESRVQKKNPTWERSTSGIESEIPETLSSRRQEGVNPNLSKGIMERPLEQSSMNQISTNDVLKKRVVAMIERDVKNRSGVWEVVAIVATEVLSLLGFNWRMMIPRIEVSNYLTEKLP